MNKIADMIKKIIEKEEFDRSQAEQEFQLSRQKYAQSMAVVLERLKEDIEQSAQNGQRDILLSDTYGGSIAACIANKPTVEYLKPVYTPFANWLVSNGIKLEASYDTELEIWSARISLIE